MSTFSIEGRTCFYQDTGTGYPLLFGHSYLWNSEMWKEQLAAFSQKYRCIAMDLWEHGKSEHLPRKHPSIEGFADDAWLLMQHLNISEFAVIGLSVGGMWGVELALKHPSRVKALVLMDTFVGSEPAATKQKYFAMLDQIEKDQKFTPEMIDQVVPFFFSPVTFSQKPQIVTSFKLALAKTPEKNISGIVSIGRAIFSRRNLLDKLPSITQPTLILVGKDDLPRPPGESKKMAAKFPRSSLHIIENAGHISCLEQPEIVNSLLLDFLSFL